MKRKIIAVTACATGVAHTYGSSSVKESFKKDGSPYKS